MLVALVLAPSPLTAGLLTALAGFLIILTFSITVVMSQEYLPSRLGLASGREPRAGHRRGRDRGRGLGVVADACGLPTVMWLIVALAVPMVVLARTLPVTRAERRAQGAAARGGGRRLGRPPPRAP